MSIGGYAGAQRRLARLEELRYDLFHSPPAATTNNKPGGKRNSAQTDNPKAAYALDTLLAMLYVETSFARIGVACALADVPPQSGKSETPPFAARICARLTAPDADPLALASGPLVPPQRAQLRTWAETTVAALLTDALNTLQLLLRPTSRPDAPALEREVEVCHAALRLTPYLPTPTLNNACLRVLRVVSLTRAREISPLGQMAAELREHVCLCLAARPPEELAAFWIGLGAFDPTASRDLLPLLDFMRDTRTVPHLLALLARPALARENDPVALAVVRALHRLRDRRALPVLRRLLKDREREEEKRKRGKEERGREETREGPAGTALGDDAPELMKALRQALYDIEHDRPAPERMFLLRPAMPVVSDLLHPVARPPATDDDGRADLLRSDEEKH